jgi:hypothetical protein
MHNQGLFRYRHSGKLGIYRKKTMDLKKLYEKTNGGLGQDHFSFTQLSKTKPIGMWIVDYFVRDQKRRRADKKNFKLGYGSVSGNVAQRLIGKYVFKGAEREEIKNRDYNTIFNYEYDLYKKESYDQRDDKIKEMVVDKLHDTIKNVLKVVKEIFGSKPLMCERYVSMSPQNLGIDILGRLDWEASHEFAEQKVKPPSVRGYDLDNIKIYTQKLPTEPDPININQVAFYRLATEKKPFLFYVNEKDYIIFDNEHPALWDDHLEYCYSEMVQKAMTIQRLLEVSNGDPKVMAGLVEKPDLSHWTMKDASADQLAVIKQLWG